VKKKREPLHAINQKRRKSLRSISAANMSEQGKKKGGGKKKSGLALLISIRGKKEKRRAKTCTRNPPVVLRTKKWDERLLNPICCR